MRALIQRVKHAEISVENKKVSEIENGLLIFLGVTTTDGIPEINFVSEKILNLRIFSDENGKMNLSVKDIGGEILVVSQFTLYANISKGRRPSFENSAGPEIANTLYEEFIKEIKKSGLIVSSGIFGADMKVSLLNDGPVTIMVEK